MPKAAMATSSSFIFADESKSCTSKMDIIIGVSIMAKFVMAARLFEAKQVESTAAAMKIKNPISIPVNL